MASLTFVAVAGRRRKPAGSRYHRSFVGLPHPGGKGPPPHWRVPLPRAPTRRPRLTPAWSCRHARGIHAQRSHSRLLCGLIPLLLEVSHSCLSSLRVSPASRLRTNAAPGSCGQVPGRLRRTAGEVYRAVALPLNARPGSCTRPGSRRVPREPSHARRDRSLAPGRLFPGEPLRPPGPRPAAAARPVPPSAPESGRVVAGRHLLGRHRDPGRRGPEPCRPASMTSRQQLGQRILRVCGQEPGRS